MERVALVTSADSSYMPLVRGMINTFQRCPEASGIEIRCLDLGLSAADLSWLSPRGIDTIQPHWHFGIREGQFPNAHIGFLARPFLRDYLPGYSTYLWLDGDL